jgi:ferric-dicitrate binding protein FerR (iron transport regulator)
VLGSDRHDVRCDRARSLASLDLDGELSEVERARLEEHMRRCPACADAREAMRTLTVTLRGAPLERPASSPLRRRAREPAPRRGVLALRLLAAAVLAALAAGLGVLATTLGGERERPSPSTPPDIALLPPRDELRAPGVPRPNVTSPEERRFQPGRSGGA